MTRQPTPRPQTPGRSWEGLCPPAPGAAQQQKRPHPAFEGWPRSACSAQVPFQNALGEGHLRSLPWVHLTDPRAHGLPSPTGPAPPLPSTPLRWPDPTSGTEAKPTTPGRL